ncbi:MAG: glycosyltransferase family 2 protein [Patescibacteria group bacterium]
MVDIAIIIVNYKTEDDVRNLLLDLRKDLASSNLKTQVVVVDNTPGNGMWLDVKNGFPEVKYLPQDYNWGFGKSQNIGIQSVEAKYYFILNPDISFGESKNVLDELYEFMETHSKLGLIGPKLLNLDGSLQYSCFRFPSFWIPFYRRSKAGEWRRNKKKVDKYLMKDFEHNKTQPVDWLIGSALFIRAEALRQAGPAYRQAGGFDENFFMYFEDCDLCRRFWEHHWPVYYYHEVSLIHRHSKASAKVQGFWQSMIKNPLTRTHIISWIKYMWKWRFMKL